MKKYTVKVFEDKTEWYNKKDQLHRKDGPAIEYADGDKYWYINGQRHREDGPAIKWSDGTKFWFLNGQRHREDGPAIEWADGDKTWYLNGHKLSKEEFSQRTKSKMIEINGKQISIDTIEAALKEYFK